MHEKAKLVCIIYMQPQIQICSNKHETGLVTVKWHQDTKWERKSQ